MEKSPVISRLWHLKTRVLGYDGPFCNVNLHDIAFPTPFYFIKMGFFIWNTLFAKRLLLHLLKRGIFSV